MKKIYYVIIFAFIVVMSSFMFNGNIALASGTGDLGDDGNGTQENLEETESSSSATMDMKTFFQNSLQYAPMNSEDSCAYVSLIQYLSYLDTFYDDDIIPEKYEKKNESATSLEEALSSSPGVLRQSYPTDLTTFQTYVEEYFANEENEKDFQLYLIKTYNKINQDICEKKGSNWVYTRKLGMQDYEGTIFKYMFPAFRNRFLRTSYSTIVREQGELTNNYAPNNEIVVDAMKGYIKDRIDEGYPVIVSLGHYTSGGSITNRHSVVAYYYEGDRIYANFGWSSPSSTFQLITERNGDEDYYSILDAGYISMGGYEEKHSNNYIINGEPYCGCGKSNSVEIYYKDEGGLTFTGTNPAEQPVYYICKTENVELLAPTKEDYSFHGWYMTSDCSGDAITEIPAQWYESGELILYAKWIKTVRPISFSDENGASFSGQLYSNQITVLTYGETVYLHEPTRENYYFGGWYLSPDCSEDSEVTSLNANDFTSDIEVYAKWFEIVSYEIDLESDSWSGNTYTYTNGHVTVISPIGTNSSNQMINVKLKRTEPTGIYNDDGDISNIFRIEIRLSRTATLTADSGSFTSEDNITWIWVGNADSVEISTSITCNVEYLRVDLLY